MGDSKLEIKVKALQLSTEGILKLLGGTSDDRLRFWEIVKGITTPRDQLVVSNQITKLQTSFKQAQASLQTLQKKAQKKR